MLIYANPTTRPARGRASKKGPKMARKKRTTRRRAVSRRKAAAPVINPRVRRRRVHRNPAVSKRRRVHRNPSFARGVLGELASMDGVMLLGAAIIAPTAVDFVVEKIVPVQFRDGWYGLAAKLALVAAGAYAIDRWGKQRKAAIGFAVGGGANLLAQGFKMMRVTQKAPAIDPAQADEIARNPSAYDALMSGSYASLNGYGEVPMAGYEMAPLGNSRATDNDNPFESLN